MILVSSGTEPHDKGNRRTDVNDTDTLNEVETDEAREAREREEQRAWEKERSKRQNALLFDAVNTLRQNKRYSHFEVTELAGNSYAADAVLEDNETTIEVQVRIRRKGEGRY